MKKIELEIIAISHSITQTQSYAVVLGEINGLRKLPIVIGSFEAQAIAIAIEGMNPARPLTHDLMKNFMNAFEIDLVEIVINDLQEGIFYSKLVCNSPSETIEIDSRTSDALALAVRMGCPIYTYEHIINQANQSNRELPEEETDEVNVGAEEIYAQSQDLNSLASLSMEELQNMLDEVLAQEDYRKAVSIRDEMKRRRKS
jgi:bifunctional DNase/RNase